MAINMQVKILKIIHEREIKSVGDSGGKAVDVRIIATTNKNFEELVKKVLYEILPITSKSKSYRILHTDHKAWDM
jgi:transcriptional regulator with AAA-type ATPase domain